MEPFRCFCIDMPTCQLNSGLNLYYLDLNPEATQAVLLLHGLGANADSWQLQAPTLVAAGYRVIAPDLRGFGRSVYTGNISIAAMSSDCLALLRQLQIDRVNVVGISMGGTVALQLALKAQPKVVSLTLINTFAKLKPASSRHLFMFMRRIWLVLFTGLARQAEMVVDDLFPQPDHEDFRREFYQQIMMSDPRTYRAAMLALWRFNAIPHLASIQSPTLVITAENDRTVAPSVQAELVQGIPDARQVMVPGAGHAVTAERAEFINQILLQFLNDPNSPA